MNNIFRFHPLERPKADSPNMLSNDERINPNIVPLEKLRAMDEDTYEDVVAAWAYCCVKSEDYQEVYRVGGAGDKGRDVIAYIDRKNDVFDLYQCKHYKDSISYSMIRGEIGKLLTYTLRGDYSVPKNYYIVSPLGVSQSFFDLLRDGARELKRLLKKDWNEHIKDKIGIVYGSDLDPEMADYIDHFDYSIIRQVDPQKFIEDLRTDGRYFFCYFGGGFSNIKREKLALPECPVDNESKYIGHLYDAYSDAEKVEVNEHNITEYRKYENHYKNARKDFYEAEEVRIASSRSMPPETDEFEELKDSIERYVSDDYYNDYDDAFKKLKTVTRTASMYNLKNMLIGHLVDSNVKKGICYHLSNEDRLIWKE